MKKLISVAAAALVFAAAPAFADDIVINVGGTAVAQSAAQVTNQAAASAAIAVGNVSDHSDVSSTALNGVNMATVNSTLVQTSDWIDGNLQLTGVNQQLQAATNQAALSIAGSGSVSGASSLTSMGANLANNANVTVTVRQQ